MEIKNENDFLGALISLKNENNEVDIGKLVKEYKLSYNLCSDYLKVLERKGYVAFVHLSGYRILPPGIEAYISPMKKIFNFCIAILKILVPFFLGMFSGDIYAFITTFLGRN